VNSGDDTTKMFLVSERHQIDPGFISSPAALAGLV